jgi:hypothetical protein
LFADLIPSERKKCLHGISNQYTTLCDDDDVHILINIGRWSFGDANFIENYVFVSGKTYSDDNEIESCLWLVRCKQILFKVEITDENLKHNWRNYAVKRTSDNVDLINQFIAHHKIEVGMFRVTT